MANPAKGVALDIPLNMALQSPGAREVALQQGAKMNSRAFTTIALIGALGSFSPQAFGQDKTVPTADLEKILMGFRTTFFMGSAEVDRDSTIFRKMSKLQDDCKTMVKGQIDAAPPVAAAELPSAILGIKKLDEDCLTAGVAADQSLARIKANYHFPTPR